MRALAAGCLVGVALVFTGCGTSQDAAKVATKTIEDDWAGFFIASSDPFPARPDLKGFATIRSIHCGSRKAGTDTLTCALVVGRGKHGGRAKSVHVRVRFDSQDVLRQWKFTG
ncbi:MAG: hypothetical protein QOI71_1318 [Gaiellales bacterium]|jgi:hypothetical protein|nr:hypothetical protein [Gaiellales bacterium]